MVDCYAVPAVLCCALLVLSHTKQLTQARVVGGADPYSNMDRVSRKGDFAPTNCGGPIN